MPSTPYTTYINGTSGPVTYQSVFQVASKLKLGHENGMFKIDRTASGYVAGLNVAVSKGDQFKKVFTAVKDRAASKPSGYGTNGMPTYGQGRASLLTNWAQDYAVYSGSVTYAVPNGREKKFFSQFTT